MRQNLLALFALFVLLVLGAGGAWLFLRGEPADGQVSPTAPVAAPEAPAGALARPGPERATTPTEPVTTLEAREEAQEQTQPRWEPSETVWLDARVALPDKTPPGDSTEVIAFLQRRDGARLAHSVDRLARGKEDRDVVRAAVDSDGAVRLGLPPGTSVAHLSAGGRYTYSDSTTPASPGAAPVVLRPKLGALVTGRLMPPVDATPEESALAGLEITLQRDPMTRIGMASIDSDDSPDERHGESGDDLRYEIRGIVPQLSYRLEVRPEGLAAVLGDWNELQPGQHLVVDAPLKRGGSISGRAVDESGAPVAAAEIEARQEAIIFGQGGMLVRETESDADGAFALRAVRAGKTRVTASADGWLETTVDIDVEEGRATKDVEIALDRGGRIAGTVTWPDGLPAADVEVGVRFDMNEIGGMGAFNAMRGARGDGRTDAEGQFEVTGLGGGPFVLTAETDRGQDESEQRLTARAEGVPPGKLDLQLVLEAPLMISGRVVDDLGEPVEKFRVYAAQARGGMFNLGSEGHSETFEDEDGRFELPGLRAGKWEVGATGTGHGESEKLEIAVPHEGELTVVLPRAASIRGIVLSPAGTPIAGARVGREMTMKDVGSMARRNGSESEAQATSDAEGRFEVGGLPTGSQAIVAKLEGFAPSEAVPVLLEPAGVVEGIELHLRVGGHLFGQVFDAEGQPDVGTTILAQIPTGLLSQRWTSTDADGRFELDHMTPGSWQVMTMFGRDSSPAGGDSASDLATMMSEIKFTMAEIKDGEEVHVVLGAPPEDPVRVSGVVTLDRKPQDSVFLTFFPDRSGEKEETGGGMQSLRFNSTNSEGYYEIDLDRPGRYLVSVQRMGTMGAQQSLELNFDIPKGEEHRLDIALPVGGIAGRVLDAEGTPVPNARVSLTNDGGIRNTTTLGGRYSEMTADSKGEFEVDWLEPGTYSMAAGGVPLGGMLGGTAQHARQVISGLTVREGDWLRNIEFRLQAPGKISGQVVDPDGKPVAGAGIFVRDESGSLLERISMFTTDGAGKFEYEGLEPATYSVCARDTTRASEFSQPVRVRSGETSEVTLRIEGGTLLLVSVQDGEGAFLEASIVVTDPDGRQVNGLFSFDQLMALFTQGGFSTREQRVGPLPPGRYKVTATTADGQSRTKPVTLGGQDERRINIRLK